MPITWPSGAVAEAFSESEDWDIKQPPTADVKLRCAWVDRHSVAFSAAGMQWPYYTSVPQYCVHAKISPVPQIKTGRDGDGNTYEQAFVELHFDPFNAFTESIKTNGEMLKINRFGVDDRPGFQIIAWDGGEGHEGRYELVSPEASPTKIVVGLDYEVSFEQLDAVPADILTLVDCVNDDTVTPINFSGLTFEAETLMMMSSDVKHTVGVDGSVKNSLSMKFGWRKNGWNKFWRSASQSWEYLYVVQIADVDIPRISQAHPQGFDADSGTTPEIYRNFPTADFSPLLPS